MSRFELADKNTRIFEGKYSNNKSDKGGETYAGISRRFHGEEHIWAFIDGYKQNPEFHVSTPRANKVIDHKKLEPIVTDFYRRKFWNRIKGDDIKDQNIANYLYDIAVNKGVRDASKYLQIGCNITNRSGRDWPDTLVDGVIGSKTLSALDAWTKKRGMLPCIALLGANILHHWQEQAIKYPNQETFINGIIQRHLVQYQLLAEQHLRKQA